MMDIRDMHILFKSLLAKVDSQQFRNIRVPEIDLYLNDALESYVNHIAYPFYHPVYGLERNQRSIDSIRNLINSVWLGVHSNSVNLPGNYWHYISAKARLQHRNCKSPKTCEVYLRKHGIILDNKNTEFYFNEVNALIIDNNLKLLVPEYVTANALQLTYVKTHPYIHAASLFSPNGYTLPNGTHLTGYSNCILPKDVCKEIVYLAVKTVTGTLRSTVDLNIKTNLLKQKDYE